MRLHLYTPLYRPPGYGTVPKGWVLVETGTLGNFPQRPDLPQGKTRHGLIGYKEPLTTTEIWAFDLKCMGVQP